MLRAFPSRRNPLDSGLRVVTLVAAGALIGFGAALAATTTPAPASFDGLWTIDAETSSPLCPVRRKKLTAFVAGGKVLAVWGLTADTATSGAVTPDGGVSIEIKAYGVIARIEGKMAGKAGQGAWSSDSLICTRGRWRASAG